MELIKNIKKLFQKEKSLQIQWRNFLGNNITDCGELIIWMETMYAIQKMNATAQAMKDKVATTVWKNGIYLKKPNGDIADRPRDKEKLNEIIRYFSTPTFSSFKNDYYTHYFASGDIYITQVQTLAWSYPVVVDSRTMQKKVDNWLIVGFKQIVKWNSKEYNTDTMYNHIIKKDPDHPYYGVSKYYSVVYDALSSGEISKRNYYFFQNNAKPDLVLMMEQIPWMDPKEYSEIVKRFEDKYAGSKNAHKTIATNAVKDIKVLEMNHKDLQLLELDVLSMKKIGMIFGIDPRLLGFSDDVGAYATMNEIGKHSMDAIANYQMDLEEDMNNVYKMFVDPSLPYRICLDGETFTDRNAIEESQRKDIELWILTVEEVRAERWLDTNKLPEELKWHYMRSNVVQVWQPVQPIQPIA